MYDTQGMLTARQFAEQAGVTAATVSKWLRDGKITGRKSGGKWFVDPDQLERLTDTAPPAAGVGDPSAAPGKALDLSADATDATASYHSVEAFADKTFLTVAGVVRYLKEGRLTGTRDEKGNWQIPAGNLDNPAIRHLLRK